MNPSAMIKELVDKVGNDAEYIIAQGLGMRKKGNSYSCPSVHNHKNGDKNPSMGWDNNKHFFNCFGCGENIDIYSYYKKYCNYTFNDIMAENDIKGLDEKRKEFKGKVKTDGSTLDAKQIEYITNRGISKQTIKKCRLGSYKGGIALPYFKNGQLTGVKVRSFNTKKQGNRMTSVTGSKFFYFNYDNVNLDEPIVICEGEFDCMTLIECGVNAISVGCGANSLQSLFDQSDMFFKNGREFIILADNDENGRNMEAKFLEVLGEKAVAVSLDKFQGYKDVNDLYLAKSKEAVKELVNSGRFKFDGEWDPDEDPYTKLDPKDTKFIPTGIDGIDNAINDIQSKTVTLITGRSNGGKSTLVNQIIASAVDNRKRTYLAIGEGDKTKIMNKWYTSMIGYNRRYYDERKFNKKTIKEPKPKILDALRLWHKGLLRFFIKSNSKYKTTEQFFSMLEKSVKKTPYDLIVLDNLMSLLTVTSSIHKNEEQARFVEKCHALAQSYNIAIVIVLHPNKGYIKSDDIDMEDISGTMDLPNKADVILGVVRYYDGDTKFLEGVDNQIQVIKNRDWSDLPKVDCKFNSETGSYLEMKKGEVIGIPNDSWKKYIGKKILKEIEKVEEEWKEGKQEWTKVIDEEVPF